jgi:FlaA1/EpsC-like NDP-sugar epimerase
MAGHDIVIHAAAMKHVVEAEYNPILCHLINVVGSMNVLEAALRHCPRHVVGISTDKACHPTNTYGATKMQMERFFQYYASLNTPTDFHLVRYGNVFASNGSFIHNWLDDAESLGFIRSTEPTMTRFWMPPEDAVTSVMDALLIPNGCIYVPKMRSASIGEIEEWVIGDKFEIKRIPIRPGEKIHETLVTTEERKFDRGIFTERNKGTFIYPRYLDMSVEGEAEGNKEWAPYTSDGAHRWTKEEFLQMVQIDL